MAVATGLGIQEIIGDKREQILQLAEKHGAYNVRVIGPVARGEAGPDDYVNLLVKWDMSRITPWGGAGLDVEAGDLLGRMVIVTSENWIQFGREQVIAEAIQL